MDSFASIKYCFENPLTENIKLLSPSLLSPGIAINLALGFPSYNCFSFPIGSCTDHLVAMYISLQPCLFYATYKIVCGKKSIASCRTSQRAVPPFLNNLKKKSPAFVWLWLTYPILFICKTIQKIFPAHNLVYIYNIF